MAAAAVAAAFESEALEFGCNALPDVRDLAKQLGESSQDLASELVLTAGHAQRLAAWLQGACGCGCAECCSLLSVSTTCSSGLGSEASEAWPARPSKPASARRAQCAAGAAAGLPPRITGVLSELEHISDRCRMAMELTELFLTNAHATGADRSFAHSAGCPLCRSETARLQIAVRRTFVDRVKTNRGLWEELQQINAAAQSLRLEALGCESPLHEEMPASPSASAYQG